MTKCSSVPQRTMYRQVILELDNDNDNDDNDYSDDRNDCRVHQDILGMFGGPLVCTDHGTQVIIITEKNIKIIKIKQTSWNISPRSLSC